MQILPRARVYAVHEFFDSPLSLYALGDSARHYNSRLGIESDTIKGGSLYSEYHVGGAIDGRSSQAAIGLRQGLQLRRGLAANFGFERTKELSGALATSDGDGTSISVSLEALERADLKWTLRAENRSASGGDSRILTGGAAWAANPDLSFLARAVWAKSQNLGLGRLQSRFQFGAAFRPTKNNRFNALAKLEWRNDKDGGLFGASQGGNRGFSLSGDASYRLNRRTLGLLHLATTKGRDNFDGLATSSNWRVIQGRLTRDLSDRFSASVIAESWSGQGSLGQHFAWGLEGSALLARDLMLSAGYNFGALSDGETSAERLRRGFYLRLKMKFDDEFFGNLKVFKVAPQDLKTQTFVPVVEDAGGSGLTSNAASGAGLEAFTGQPGQFGTTSGG